MTNPGVNPMCSVVIPAHDEVGVIGRLLDLLGQEGRGLLDIVVVCNGCTDGTERVAREHPCAPTVISIPEASKHLALQAGDAAASHVPRFYVDADIEIAAADLLLMAEVLQFDGVHAVAPRRVMDLSRSPWVVRFYYDAWARTPAVREGLFGRGVMGVDHVGLERISGRPDVLGDDLFLHESFDPSERRVVERATSLVRAPRTTRDLVRRRVRAVSGNRQLAQVARLATSRRPVPSRTAALTAMLSRGPRDVPHVAVYLTITAMSRVAASIARDKTAWRRDESSRRAS